MRPSQGLEMGKVKLRLNLPRMVRKRDQSSATQGKSHTQNAQQNKGIGLDSAPQD